MRKIEVNIYTYDELDEKVKNELLETQKELDFESYCDFELENDMQDIAKKVLDEYFKGAEYAQVWFDLSYRQGSGAMLEFNTTLENINNKYKMLSKKEMEKIKEVGFNDIKVYHISNYCHEYSFDFDYKDYTYYIDNFEKTQEKLDKMLEQFKHDIVNMNCDITQKGYDLLENFEADSEEVLKDNEYLKDGTIYYEGVF